MQSKKKLIKKKKELKDEQIYKGDRREGKAERERNQR
jgi:hypothetical protein